MESEKGPVGITERGTSVVDNKNPEKTPNKAQDPSPAKQANARAKLNPDSFWWRAILALPLLVISLLEPDFTNKRRLRTSHSKIGITGHLWPDRVISTLLPFTYGSSPPRRASVVSSLADGGVLSTIITIEAMRGAGINAPFEGSLLVFNALQAQIFGAGNMVPFYLWGEYLFRRKWAFDTPGARRVQLRRPALTIPIIAALFHAPLLAAYLSPGLAIRHTWLFVWQPFPVWITIAYRLVAMPRNEGDEILDNGDMPAIRASMGALIVLATGTWIRTVYVSTRVVHFWRVLDPLQRIWPSPKNMIDVLMPNTLHTVTKCFYRFKPDLTIAQQRIDEAAVFLAVLWWLVLLYRDLFRVGYVGKRMGWAAMSFVVVALLGVATVVVGPAATLGLGWLIREHLLASAAERGKQESEGDKNE